MRHVGAWGILMKKTLIAASLIAASTATASAADLAARPYTKAPPMVAAIYDWSGFYIGANAGYGSSRKEWDSMTTGGAFVAEEGSHDATGAEQGAKTGTLGGGAT